MHGNSRAECIRVEGDVKLTPLAAAALSALAILAPTTAAAPIITFAVVHVTVFGLTVFGFTVIFATGAGVAVVLLDIVVWTSRPGPLYTLLVVNLVIAVVHAKSAKAHILVGLAILVDFISTSDSHRRRAPTTVSHFGRGRLSPRYLCCLLPRLTTVVAMVVALGSAKVVLLMAVRVLSRHLRTALLPTYGHHGHHAHMPHDLMAYWHVSHKTAYCWLLHNDLPVCNVGLLDYPRDTTSMCTHRRRTSAPARARVPSRGSQTISATSWSCTLRQELPLP